MRLNDYSTSAAALRESSERLVRESIRIGMCIMLPSDSDMTNEPVRRFVADAMLGKLAKWLRVMGIDVVYDPTATDDQLRKSAERDQRILLTRDYGLTRQMAKAAPETFLFIESDYYHEQVRQVVQRFGLVPVIRLFTRCLRCNSFLQSAAKEVIIEKVPPYIRATQTSFKYCAMCKVVYWAGTHRDHMLQQITVLLAGVVIKPHDDLSSQSKEGPHQA